MGAGVQGGWLAAPAAATRVCLVNHGCKLFQNHGCKLLLNRGWCRTCGSHEAVDGGDEEQHDEKEPCQRPPQRAASRESGNLLPNNRRQRRTCYALCHILYPVSAAHTSIFQMDSNSTSYPIYPSCVKVQGLFPICRPERDGFAVSWRRRLSTIVARPGGPDENATIVSPRLHSQQMLRAVSGQGLKGGQAGWGSAMLGENLFRMTISVSDTRSRTAMARRRKEPSALPHSPNSLQEGSCPTCPTGQKRVLLSTTLTVMSLFVAFPES